MGDFESKNQVTVEPFNQPPTSYTLVSLEGDEDRGKFDADVSVDADERSGYVSLSIDLNAGEREAARETLAGNSHELPDDAREKVLEALGIGGIGDHAPE